MRHVLFTFALVIAALAAPFAHAQPLGTAFTYQGRLNDGGNPADGSYDMQFSLYMLETGGEIFAGPICDENVDVQDGLFSAWVDFGADVFNGEALWLEIEVRADGTPGNCATGVYSALTPRQELTAAPNALYATTATNATLLNGQPAVFYQNASNLNAGTLPSARLLGTYSNRLTLSHGSNLFTGSFTGSGAGLTNLDADLLDGLTSTDFLRSTLPLTLSAPSDTHILLVQNTTNSSGVFSLRGEATGALSLGGIGVYGLSAGPTGTGVYGVSTSTSPAGGYGVQGHASSTTGRGVYGNATAATGTTYGVYGQSASPSGYGVLGTSIDNIGVRGEATGTTGINYGVYGESDSTSGLGVFGQATAATGTADGGRFLSASTSGRGVFGWATALSGITYGVRGHTSSPDGYAGYFTGEKSYFEGNVGIGTDSPDGKLHLVGESDAEPDSGGLFIAGLTTSTNVVIDNNEIMARNNGATAALALNGDGGNVNLIQNGTGNVGIGTSSPQAKLHVDGNTRLDGTVFIAPIRRWLSVHYSAFNVNHSDVEVTRNNGYVHHLSSGVTAGFVAPVQLPDGADIISMTAYLINDLPNDNVLLELVREPLAGDPIARDVICAVSSSGESFHSVPYTDSTPNTAFDHVDNNLYAYSLYASIPYQFYGVRGVVIEYEIDRPLP